MKYVGFHFDNSDGENFALAAAMMSILITGCAGTNGKSLIDSMFVCSAASCVVSRWTVRLAAPGVCQLLVVVVCVILSWKSSLVNTT